MAVVQSNNSKIAKNTAFLYIRMFFVLLVSLYTSRVVLNTLGVSDYGIFNVVAGFVSLFAFLNSTLSASVQRFYNYEMGKKGEEGISNSYTAGFWIHVVLATVLLILFETFGLWYVNNVLVIPEGRELAANIVYQAAVVSAVLIVFQIPYVGAILAYEKMDFYAVVSIIDVVLRLGIVFALPLIPYDKLVVYAILTILTAIIDFCIYFVYSKKKFGYLTLKKRVDKELTRSMLSFSGWNLIGTFAFSLKGQGVNLLLNYFFGTIINAARGIAFQIYGAIHGFSQNITVAFRPQVVDAYAKGNIIRTKKLFYTESKICFILILVLMIPVVLDVDYIVHLWLGDIVPEYTNIFSILVLVDLLIGTLNAPTTQVVYANGNTKNYQLITSCVNLLLIPVCFIFLRIGFDPTSVFIITIAFTCINQTICILILRKLMSFSIKEYLFKVILPCFIAVLLIPLLPTILRYLMSPGIVRLIAICAVDMISAVLVVWCLLLNSDEKSVVNNYIKKK